MLKIVLSSSFDFGMPAASLIDVYSKGIDRCWLEKRAAVFNKEIAEIRPERGHSYIQLITMGAQEWFGCFPKGTAVRMGDAIAKPIETVKVGDAVVTHRGRVRAVTHTYQRSYSGPVCSLSISGMLEPVVCTSNHKFYVIPAAQVCCAIDKEDHCKPSTCRQNGICMKCNCARAFPRYEPEWKAAEELREGDYVLIPIPDRGVGNARGAPLRYLFPRRQGRDSPGRGQAHPRHRQAQAVIPATAHTPRGNRCGSRFENPAISHMSRPSQNFSNPRNSFT